MLSDVQSQKIVKYRKLAKKNLFCRYLATLLLVISIVCSKFITFHRKRIIACIQLCLLFCIFFLNTSFAPPTFSTVLVESDYSKMQETELNQVVEYDLGDTKESAQDEHDLIDTQEDTASLDDLIEQSKMVAASEIIETEETRELFDKQDWKLLLINKQHTIPEDYEFTLGTIKGSMRCDERIIEPLTQMFAAAKEDTVNLIVCSPYRDMARQEYLFERKVKNYIKTGMSYMEAYKRASITVTVPGASEHQVGLAVDIISDRYTSLDEGFANTDAGKWLKDHSWEYGFILRYPLGKEEITGIQYEPWHFRYVGVEAAKVITEQNITLEEFVENL